MPNAPSNCCCKARHLWNAGIFLVQAKVLIAALEEHAPDILESCRRAPAVPQIDGDFIRMDRDTFESCRSQSIDYAVLEKCEHVAVIPFRGAWSDVGSWNAVAALHDADERGNRLSGHGFALGSATRSSMRRRARWLRWVRRIC